MKATTQNETLQAVIADHEAEVAARKAANKERLARGHYLRRPKGKSWIPEPTQYESRVRALEAEGLTRSDAQGVADMEDRTWR